MSCVARRKVNVMLRWSLIEGQVAWSDASAPARLPNIFQRLVCYSIIQRIKTSAKLNIHLVSHLQITF